MVAHWYSLICNDSHLFPGVPGKFQKVEHYYIGEPKAIPKLCHGKIKGMSGLANHICTNEWSTKSGLKRCSFVTLSLRYFRSPVRSTASSICTVRHNEQSFTNSFGSPTAGTSFSNSTCPLSAAMQILNTSPCISTEPNVNEESGRRAGKWCKPSQSMQFLQ